MPGEGKRRSRSRSPPVASSRPPGSRGTQSAKAPVNMLDVAAIELAKNPGPSTFNRKAERITCTIPGKGRGLQDRLSGGDFARGDRRVSVRGSIQKPSSAPMNRKERRAALQARLTRDPHRRRRDEEDDERRNGSFRDADKPVQRLVDPTVVPRSRAFFDHDDRESGDRWKGRTVYDPRIDFGPRHNRHHRSTWEGFGDRRDRDRDRHNRDRSDRDGRRGRKFGDADRDRSGAEGLWTHDKFVELEDDTNVKKGETLVVNSSKTTRQIDEE